jgi:protein ImuA
MPAALHEFYAAAHADAISQTCLALGLAQTHSKAHLLWVRQAFLDREFGTLNPCGLAELGIDPGTITLMSAPDVMSALKAALDGARCAKLGTVLVELWGDHAALDLTASRRLAMAAKASGARIMMLRCAARQQPSAAETRWEVRAAPSRALPANAPGNPAFTLELLRARNGLEGHRYHLEWDRDTRSLVAFAIANEAGRPPLSGAVVPFSPHRAGGDGADHERIEVFRKTG